MLSFAAMISCLYREIMKFNYSLLEVFKSFCLYFNVLSYWEKNALSVANYLLSSSKVSIT